MHVHIAINSRRLPHHKPRRSGRRDFGRRAIHPHPVGADYRRRSSAATADAAGRRVPGVLGVLTRAALAVRGRQAPPASGLGVEEEMLHGAAIGLVVCLVLAWLSGGSLLSVRVALFWGSCVGALIGLLLWAGSPDAPEDPVLPPSPGQGRESRKLRSKPRPRR